MNDTEHSVALKASGREGGSGRVGPPCIYYCGGTAAHICRNLELPVVDGVLQFLQAQRLALNLVGHQLIALRELLHGRQESHAAWYRGMRTGTALRCVLQ